MGLDSGYVLGGYIRARGWAPDLGGGGLTGSDTDSGEQTEKS